MRLSFCTRSRQNLTTQWLKIIAYQPNKGASEHKSGRTGVRPDEDFVIFRQIQGQPCLM
jgi:hypothetical protein